jgi:hypothetical protein
LQFVEHRLLRRLLVADGEKPLFPGHGIPVSVRFRRAKAGPRSQSAIV